MKSMLMIFIATVLLSTELTAQRPTPGGEAYPELRTHEQALAEFRNMKFGMFIHWGPVALRGEEIGWSRGKQIPIGEYDNLYREFNPVLFNADEWVAIAKSAGMKYLILTSKHHDGFCLWPSGYAGYDIAETPYRKDVIQQLADACKRQGIDFGLYYSIADWHHPHYATRYGGDPRPVEESQMDLYVDYLRNQVRELIQKYDVNFLWFDGHWEEAWTHEAGMDLYAYCRSLKDDLLINNRVDKGRVRRVGTTVSNKFAGDYDTPEQQIGRYNTAVPWETCMTLCTQWAWKPNDRMKSLRECIHILVRTVGGDGNLLLNVGPMADGRIEMRQGSQLKQIGEWLEAHGESLYGTRGGPYKPSAKLVSTRKGNTIYLHLLDWSEEKVNVPAIAGRRVVRCSIMHGQIIECQQEGNRLVIQIPEEARWKIDTVITLELDGSAENIEAIDVD